MHKISSETAKCKKKKKKLLSPSSTVLFNFPSLTLSVSLSPSFCHFLISQSWTVTLTNTQITGSQLTATLFLWCAMSTLLSPVPSNSLPVVLPWSQMLKHYSVGKANPDIILVALTGSLHLPHLILTWLLLLGKLMLSTIVLGRSFGCVDRFVTRLDNVQRLFSLIHFNLLQNCTDLQRLMRREYPWWTW